MELKKKKMTESGSTVETTKQKATVKKDSSNKIVKLIKNPMKISLSIVLNDYKPYTLTNAQLKDKIFMTHIEKLISLKKIERV